MITHLIRLVVPLLLIAPWPAIAGSGTGKALPAVLFPSESHRFSPVLEGKSVSHDFVYENRGNAELRITKVRTDWGCTASSYDERVPAGGRGKISVTIDTSGSGGSSIKKRIFVYTNDPGRKRVLLIVRGDVIRFVHISPTRVNFKGNVGEPLSVRVYIRQTADYPFAITGVRSMYGRDIRYVLEEIPERHPREYLLVVDSVRVIPGRINDMIYLDTDHPTRPVLQVPVAGTLSLQPVFSGTEGTPAK